MPRFLIPFSNKYKPGFLGEMADSRTGTGNIDKSLEHLMAPESKEVLKRQNKPKTNPHGIGGVSKDTVAS